MKSPLYVILPIVGAVVLAAAVLGSWLWPAPTVSPESGEPSMGAAPVTRKAPVPSLAPVPPPSRPVNRPVAVKPVQPPPGSEPQPSEPETEPETEPVPTSAPAESQFSDLSPESRDAIWQKMLSAQGGTGDLSRRVVEQLERQREAARARGERAEVERLEALIRQQQGEQVRGARPEVPPLGSGRPPPTQAGPPLK